MFAHNEEHLPGRVAEAAARGFLEHGSSAMSARVAAAEIAVANAAAEHAADGRAKPASSSPRTAGDGARTLGLYPGLGSDACFNKSGKVRCGVGEFGGHHRQCQSRLIAGSTASAGPAFCSHQTAGANFCELVW